MNILAFFAHPDDETMLCGGTLALLARQGATITLLCATRGEGGENGEPPVCSRDALGAVRSQELICAGQALGLAQVEFLNYIDPTVGPDNTLYPFTDDETFLTGQVLAMIQRTQAGALISHGSNGEYGHPAHQLCHRAAQAAVKALGASAPLFYTIQAAYAGHPRERLMNAADPAHLVLDCSEVLAEKTAAAVCHVTQHALFIRNTSRELGRTVTVPEVIRTEESLHRAYPPVQDGQGVEDDLAGLLLRSKAVLPLPPAV